MMAAGRIPTATALAILSIEESGKAGLLRAFLLAESDSDVREAWKHYRNHTSKNVLWTAGALVAQGSATVQEVAQGMADPKYPAALEGLKQLCIYTDCLGNARWSNPSDVALAEIAPYLLTMADVAANSKPETEAGLRLWQRHLLPVKGKGIKEHIAATRNWYMDMVKHGLAEFSEEQYRAIGGGGDGDTDA